MLYTQYKRCSKLLLMMWTINIENIRRPMIITYIKKPFGILWIYLFSRQHCSESCCCCFQYMSCTSVTFFTRSALTQAGSSGSGTRRESSNFRSKSICSMMRIAARSSSIFHFPSWWKEHKKEICNAYQERWVCALCTLLLEIEHKKEITEWSEIKTTVHDALSYKTCFSCYPSHLP